MQESTTNITTWHVLISDDAAEHTSSHVVTAPDQLTAVARAAAAYIAAGLGTAAGIDEVTAEPWDAR